MQKSCTTTLVGQPVHPNVKPGGRGGSRDEFEKMRFGGAGFLPSTEQATTTSNLWLALLVLVQQICHALRRRNWARWSRQAERLIGRRSRSQSRSQHHQSRTPSRSQSRSQHQHQHQRRTPRLSQRPGQSQRQRQNQTQRQRPRQKQSQTDSGLLAIQLFPHVNISCWRFVGTGAGHSGSHLVEEEGAAGLVGALSGRRKVELEPSWAWGRCTTRLLRWHVGVYLGWAFIWACTGRPRRWQGEFVSLIAACLCSGPGV